MKDSNRQFANTTSVIEKNSWNSGKDQTLKQNIYVYIYFDNKILKNANSERLYYAISDHF